MVRVRPVEAGDLNAWIEMRCALLPDEDSNELAEEAAAFLRDGRGRGAEAVLVSQAADGEVTGYVEIGLRIYAEGCRGSPVPYIEEWFVVPDARRTGVGRALVAAAEAWARERGYAEIASDALLDNVMSQHAHQALGFEEVERQVAFRKDLS
jgi:aminoglycoside 6'-N-acetyltransferase I